MGYSAGGHLALLYAYKAAKCAGCTYNDICPNVNLPEDVYCDKHKVSPAIPIELVISEAGPTDFLVQHSNGNLILPDANVCAMAGVMDNDSETDKAGKLTNASPVTYANDSFPFTIYARGSNDSTIPVSQPIKLVKKLLPSYANVIDTSIEQALQSNSLADQANCAFFSFANVAHADFGEKENGETKIMHPESTKTGPWDQAREDYYSKIEDELNLLYRST